MRVVATEYLSRDGVFEEAGAWSGPWFNEEAGAFQFAELMATDADGDAQRNLRLVDTETFASGIVILEYEPAG